MSAKTHVWKSLLRFAKSILHSRLGQILFVIHSVLVIYVFTERGSVLARPIHPHYESFWMNILLWLDLPALVLASIIAAPIAHESSPISGFWWVPAITNGIALLFASLQWWCLGFLIARLLQRNSPMPSSS